MNMDCVNGSSEPAASPGSKRPRLEENERPSWQAIGADVFAGGSSEASSSSGSSSRRRKGIENNVAAAEAAAAAASGVDLFETRLTSDEALLSILQRLTSRTDRDAASLVCKRWLRVMGDARVSCSIIRAEAAEVLSRRFPRLESINCSDVTRLQDSHVLLLAGAYRERLTALNFSRNKSLTASALAAIGQHCTRLAHLNLGFGTFQDAALVPLASCQSLKSLDLSNCRSITDVGICCVAAGCKQLLQLRLKWCVGITNRGVQIVARNCRSLLTLDLSYTQVSLPSLQVVAKLPSLSSLVVAGCPEVDDAAIASLRHGCTSLTSLDVSKCLRVSDVGLMATTTGGIPLLELNASLCPQVSDNLMASLLRFPSLRILRLDCCSISDAGVRALAGLRGQQGGEEEDEDEEGGGEERRDGGERVGERGGHGDGVGREDMGVASSAAAYAAGGGLRHLQELSLRRCEEITDASLAPLLLQNSELRRIDLTCCRQISDATLAALSTSCRSLCSLKMEGCTSISSYALQSLCSSCQLISEFDFTDCGLLSEGIKAIAHCTNLRTLKLGFDEAITDDELSAIGASCHLLEEVDLYRCHGFTAVGFEALALGSPSIRELNLSYCTGVNDDCLRAVGHCKLLRNLEIRGLTNATSRGLAAMAESCLELQELDLKRCRGIDDEGLIALSQHCRILRQINLSYCLISDRGLLAISRMHCINKLNLVHCTNLTIEGFSKALLQCQGLIKVKLNPSWRETLPHELISTLEERGCRFRWMDKPLP